MILSFALTTEEFLSGEKTVTRRDFKPRQIKTWQKQWDEHPHKLHKAYDKLPFAKGQLVGHFRLTCRPYQERLADMPHEDLEAEGGMVDSLQGFADLVGKDLEHVMTVIRFQKV